jgi:hypothetical protein
MPVNILIVQGHPDPAGGHLCNALGDAYAEGAEAAGNPVRRIDLARYDFPILRSRIEFETGSLPATLETARQDLVWAQHVVLIFPLWLGAMPALVKAFPGADLATRHRFRLSGQGAAEKASGRAIRPGCRHHGNARVRLSLVLFLPSDPRTQSQRSRIRRLSADPHDVFRHGGKRQRAKAAKLACPDARLWY